MRIFPCPTCGVTVSFENLFCGCGTQLGFDDHEGRFTTLRHACANRSIISCNWNAPDEGRLCRSCAMTEVVPDAFKGENQSLWAKAELAKRWVLATLARWGWFSAQDSGPRPVFHLLAEDSYQGNVFVSMGHENGVVTINVTEADAVTRMMRSEELDERLRTMIGHFRHEIAHFLFERLGASSDQFLDEFRQLFGDERADYGEALKQYYESGPQPGWPEDHVTPYAASHPHEDWAESAAHLMHITDIADSFAAAGLSSPSLATVNPDVYAEFNTDALVSLGVELGIALNHVNRSMGLSDLYPFVLTPAIRSKLAFAHRWLRPS